VSQSRQVDRRARRPAPPPKEADDRLVTTVLTVGWALALAVLLVVRSSLSDGVRWWLWTCTAGLAMGLFALWYVPFLKYRRATIAARHALSAPPEPAGAAEPESVVPEPGYSSRDSGSNTVSSTETPGSSTRS
jgi:hypothetical protein